MEKEPWLTKSWFLEIIGYHLAPCGVLLRHAKGHLGSSIVIACFQFGDFPPKKIFGKVFFWLFVQVPQNQVRQASKKEEVEKLSSCGQDTAHIIFLKRCEESPTSPLKNTFWSYGSHSQRVTSSQFHRFLSHFWRRRGLIPQRCVIWDMHTPRMSRSLF